MEEAAWSCRSCLIVHRPEVAGMVLDGLMRGESLQSVWRKLEALL